LTFRELDPVREIREQRALFKECFPENDGTPVETTAHYSWKFHSKKSNLKTPEFGAYEGEEMLGYYAAIPYTYIINREQRNVAMVCDVMTGIKARGKGVFTKLGIYSTEEFAKRGFDFSTGFPIRPEVIPGHIKAGWENYFPLPMYGRFIRFNSFLKTKKIEFLAPVANLGLSLFTRISGISGSYPQNKFTLEHHESSQIAEIKGLNVFFEKWKGEGKISLSKDDDFLNWRLGAPGKKYHILVMRDKGSIVGYVVSRPVVKEGVPCLGVLDVILLEDYHKYSSLIFKELFRLAAKLKTELVLFMINDFWYRKYKMKTSGFIKTPFTFYFILKLFNKNLDTNVLKNQENWHLTWIDSDDL
jgi:hypothetical protein